MSCDLGPLIQTHRLRRRWSQRQLALRVPIDEKHLGRWERGRRPVPMNALARLAWILMAPDLLEAACRGCPITDAHLNLRKAMGEIPGRFDRDRPASRRGEDAA